MNNETSQEFVARIEGMLAMGFLSTIPPLKRASDMERKFRIPIELCGMSEPTPYDPADEPCNLHGWHFATGGGLYDVVGYPATSYLTSERLLEIVQTGKKVVVVGEDSDGEFDEMCRTHLGDDVVDDWFVRFKDRDGVPFTLSDEDDAMELRDIIATDRIGTVVLLHQQDKLEHLSLIATVPVYRGKERVHIKKVPIFHVQDSEPFEFNTSFAKVVKQAVANDEDRVGCTQAASTIVKEHREWLWPGYLGRNKVAHFGGASTEGKSPVTLDLIARLTSGSAWPDGSANTVGPRSAILLAAEDDWSDTIIPRLELAGADLKKVYRFFVKQQAAELTPSLDNDCQRLDVQIKQIGDVGLVVIDPITNYLGNKKMNLEEEMRGILMPLAAVAKNNNCSIVTVGHLNKKGADASVLQRLMGAAAFGGVARDVFIFGPDPDEEDKYAHTMSETRNKSAPQLKYRTEAVQVAWAGKESEVIRVKWCGVSHADLDEVVTPSKQKDKNITSRAVMLISGMLRSGAKRKAEIDQALKDNGIDPEKVEWTRIRKRCKAESRALPGKGAGWEWFLPTKQEQIFDSTQGAAKQ